MAPTIWDLWCHCHLCVQSDSRKSQVRHGTSLQNSECAFHFHKVLFQQTENNSLLKDTSKNSLEKCCSSLHLNISDLTCTISLTSCRPLWTLSHLARGNKVLTLCIYSLRQFICVWRKCELDQLWLARLPRPRGGKTRLPNCH